MPHAGSPLRPDLALVVIARDEARCIERCLRSAAPHVDRMLLLDTGSRDDTVAIAAACGARVHHAAWRDDFSAARNQALELADADWNLVLDADEWLTAGAEALREAAAGAPAIGLLQIRSVYDQPGATGHAGSWLPRLLPRGVRYAGRIHEQPVSELARVRLPIIVEHDGYAAAPLAAKRGRNRALLHSELQRAPDDPYLLYQLGKDCEVYGEHAEACRHYLGALDRAPATAAYRHDLSVRLLHCLGRAERLEEAIARAQAMLHDWSDSPDFFFTLGNLLLDAATLHPQQALDHWLPLAEAAWQRCLEIGERTDLEGSVAGRGSYLAAHNLAVIHEGRGHAEQAAHYRHLAQQLRSQASPRPMP